MRKIKQIFISRIFVWTAVLLLSISSAVPESMAIVHAETMVYVTPTGTKYHTHACGRGSYSLTTLSNALARGLEPCSKCFGSGYTPSPAPTPAPVPTPTPAPVPTPAPAKPIKINKTSILLLKGQTTRLKVTNATESISWHSSKPSVASVSSDGKVSAKKSGTATITAKTGNTEKRCKVTVESPKLSAVKLSLNVKKTKKIKLSGCKHSVKWSTSNSSVAKVKRGTITAKRPGSAKITAKAHGKKFTCKVTVKKPQVQKIVLGKTSVQMGYDAEKTIKISTKPANAMNYYKVSVKSSNPSIINAYFDDYDNTIQLESHYKSGNAVITVSVGGKTAKCQVKVAPDPVTSLTLYTTDLTLESGDSHYITFDVEPYESIDYYDIIWTSADPSVATVTADPDDPAYAIINAVSEGETDITLTLGGKTATCHITVQQSEQEIL